MKPKFATPKHADANGQVALAIAASLLDVLVNKTKTLSKGEASLILDQAARALPQSPHATDEEAKILIADLRNQLK
jgi:hypothetical protein